MCNSGTNAASDCDCFPNSPKKDNNIIVTVKEYLELLECAKKLEALESAGVDNWEGYDEAMRIMHEGEEVFKGL